MNRTGTVGLALFCVVLTSAAQIALKLGVSGGAMQSQLDGQNQFGFLARALVAPMVIAGLGLYAASTLLWLFVLAKLDVSYAYPFVSLGFVFTALYGYLAMDVPMALARIAGISLIVVGVVLVARS